MVGMILFTTHPGMVAVMATTPTGDGAMVAEATTDTIATGMDFTMDTIMVPVEIMDMEETWCMFAMEPVPIEITATTTSSGADRHQRKELLQLMQNPQMQDLHS